MTDKLKIALFCIQSGKMTGSDKMVIRLAKGLDDDSFSPLLITQSEGELARSARDAGVAVKIAPFPGTLDTYNRGLVTTSISQNIATLLRLLQYNATVSKIFKQADVVWCINVRMLLTISPLVMFSNTPVVMNIGLGLSSEGIYKWLNEFAFRIVDHVFIESETQARRLYGSQFSKYRDKFTLFHKGIDTQKFSPNAVDPIDRSDDDTIRIGTAATLTERKGHLEAIEAIGNIVAQFPDRDIRYTIAGGMSREEHREYKQRLDERISELGLGDVVEFVGWIDPNDMPAYYASLDIFILASEGEGISGAVREALAMECAVIATDVGGTSEAVIDGETGYLVPPNDSDAIAEAITSLLHSPELRHEMGVHGRNHIVNDFSVESYINDYEQFLSRVAKSE